MVVVRDPDQLEIRQVWADNMEHEMGLIQYIVDDYPYITMDTQYQITFPKHINIIRSDDMNSYDDVKTYVEKMKLIQLGLTFTDANGLLPTSVTDSGKHSVWQFNFREFDYCKDPYDPYLMDLLEKTGINFERNMIHGVDQVRFGELLTSSGMVMKDDVHWITFHGPSDFGYLVRILTGSNLPETREQFDEQVKMYFPVLYDINCLLSHLFLPRNDIGSIARMLGVKSVGTGYNSGSESLMVNRVFLKLREEHFSDQGDLEKHAGLLYGIE